MSGTSAKAFRTIWVSDLHMGAREAQCLPLLDFLKHHDSEQLYLVGDMFDGWALKRRWQWSQEYNDVIQKLLRRARKGCKITYIPGNHDSFARAYDGLKLGGITIRRKALHTTCDGRRLLVMHGDEFDGVVRTAPWLARLGSVAYEAALATNHWFNRCRQALGLEYWSLSAWLKHQVKNAVSHIDRFENAVAAEALRHEADGIVCGHIHRACIRDFDGITYYNTGDWVESCSALVEHFDGSMEIVKWIPAPSLHPVRRSRVEPAPVAEQLPLRMRAVASRSLTLH